MTSIHNGGLVSGKGSSAQKTNDFQGHPGHSYQQNLHNGYLSHDNYRQSPAPVYENSSGSYMATQSTRGQPYVNLQGVTYDSSGFSKDDACRNLVNDGGASQYQNYHPKYLQQYYEQDQQYSTHQPDSYPTYVDGNQQQVYYDDQYQVYERHNSYPNEFAATSLLLSPADSEAPSDLKQRFNRQPKQHLAQPTSHGYGSSTEIENQRLLKPESTGNLKAADVDASDLKLGTIREEIDAAEVVAGIDRLLH